ncbi:MAG: menaquinone biosynthetic enzyme MqnA/MqnD family protein [Bacteroidota bacterium]
MDKIKISAVSYLNSKPFIYGLQHSDLMNKIDLSLDIPSVCAQKLITGKADIGLVPVSAISQLKEHYIISNYCIGANGKVASVMLYSQVPLNNIKNILLDYQSITSVTLVKVLAKNYWKINPTWTPTSSNFEDLITANTAAVIIGDRTFSLKNKYKYAYDLADEWQKFTQLPFVFACWVANKKIPDVFIDQFNKALQKGLDDRPLLIKELKLNAEHLIDIELYLNNNISYNYDSSKKQALKRFLDYSTKLEQ